jgi:hypothetical protein
MKVFILCLLSGNDLADIQVCADFDTALKHLNYDKKRYQIIEYDYKDGITNIPLCSYSYEDNVLVRHIKYTGP